MQLSGRERIAKCERIMRRQNTGQITHEQACLEFDEMLMREDPEGILIYYSDSTGLTAPWDKDVMLFPATGSTIDNRIPSNTGIYARGPKRGNLITFPAGERPTCDPGVLSHFRTGSKGWIGREANA